MSLTAAGPVAFGDIANGRVFTTSHSFDEAELDRFAALSGDYSPLHADMSAAAALGFPRRVVYGFHMLALLSRIVGTQFKNAICVAVDADFVAPAYCGDEIAVSAEVMQMQPAMRTVRLRTVFIRGAETVARGKLTVRFLPD